MHSCTDCETTTTSKMVSWIHDALGRNSSPKTEAQACGRSRCVHNRPVLSGVGLSVLLSKYSPTVRPCGQCECNRIGLIRHFVLQRLLTSVHLLQSPAQVF